MLKYFKYLVVGIVYFLSISKKGEDSINKGNWIRYSFLKLKGLLFNFFFLKLIVINLLIYC